ncbi:hypothetical protein CQ017_10505 [Arthrobacter sp. MYb224]|uniref:hypothetical protein n=1 Tax=unclassified Arthrobacter TaxID=235627 RepID=UPI000CFD30DC|nr:MULTISPECIES: hypothetical protein [unclassified Arthrobacter]PQZ98935.1 hypothetical protein CQ017_10505 [Arthrobacter sp. MYb224]PRA03280.1 hypothetical protein CQ019_12650 [Arthrobacter sp. MYb229]PRB49751.1 hypothetical protein CQ013_14130 [Arthrobacter sp. MYb216]
MSNASGAKSAASVYRRRRIAVVAIALAIVGLLVWGTVALAGILGASPAGAGDPQAAPTNSASPSESAEPSSDGKCTVEEIEITAQTDAGSYATDKQPVLILGIENTSKRECELNVGTTQQEFLITSGNDRIFSTVDCLTDGEDVQLMMKPGQKESARFSWSRQRSAPGCKSVNVQPRPGTYKFTAALGENNSEPVTFQLD